MPISEPSDLDLNNLLNKANNILATKKIRKGTDLKKIYFAYVLRQKGLTIQDIAKLLNISRQTARRLLALNKTENHEHHLARLQKAKDLFAHLYDEETSVLSD